MSSVRDIESQQYPVPSDSSTVAEPSDTRAGAEHEHSPSGSAKASEKPAEETDVVWVDWEGPDDPENPKKCAALGLVCPTVILNGSLQLAIQEKVGGDLDCVSVHLYQPCLLVDGRSSWDGDRSPVQHT